MRSSSPSRHLVDGVLQAKSTKLSTDCAACLAGPEKLTRSLIQALNNCDYDNPIFKHMSAKCHTEHEYIVTRSKAEIMETHRKLTTLFPDMHVNVLNTTAEVDEVNGKAKVWISLEMIGYPTNGRREGISLVYWRVSHGEWSVYRNCGLTHGGGGD